jgi:cation:H+ antiporter
VAIILALRFHWWSAIGLAALFGVQFLITDTTGRYVLSAIHLALTIGFLVAHRHSILPTLVAPFHEQPAVDQDEPKTVMDTHA